MQQPQPGGPLPAGTDWRESVTTEIRRRVIQKLLAALKDCVSDNDIPTLTNLAIQIENTVFKQAKSHQEYFKFTAEKIYTLQRKKQQQMAQQPQQGQQQQLAQQPTSTSVMQQTLPPQAPPQMRQQQLAQQQQLVQQQQQLQQQLAQQQLSQQITPQQMQQMAQQQMAQQQLVQQQQLAQQQQQLQQQQQQQQQLAQQQQQQQMAQQQMAQGGPMGQPSLAHLGMQAGPNLAIRPMLPRGQGRAPAPPPQQMSAGVTTTAMGSMPTTVPKGAIDPVTAMLPLQSGQLSGVAPNPATLQHVLLSQNIAALNPSAGQPTAVPTAVPAPTTISPEAEKYFAKLKSMQHYTGPLATMIKQIEKHIENYSNDKQKQDNLKLVNKKMISIYRLLLHQGYPSQNPNVQVLEAAEKQIKHWLQQLPPSTVPSAPPAQPPSAPAPAPAPVPQPVPVAPPPVAPVAPPTQLPIAPTPAPIAVTPEVPVSPQATTVQKQATPPQQLPASSPPLAPAVNTEVKTEAATSSPPAAAASAPATALDPRHVQKLAQPKNTFVRFVEMVRELDPPAVMNASKLFAQVLDQFATGPSKVDTWDAGAMGHEQSTTSLGFWFESGTKKTEGQEKAEEPYVEWCPPQFESKRWDHGTKKRGEKRKREPDDGIAN